MIYRLLLIATICTSLALSANAQTDYKAWAEEAIIPNIREAKQQIDNYNPTYDSRLVSQALHPWLYRAVSSIGRNKYYEEKGQQLKKYLDPELDALAESAKKKLPTYLPGPTNFSYHNVAEERMIRERVQNWAPGATILKIGLVNTNWMISKNDYDLPTARYKWGKALIKPANSTHPYCWLVSVNIVQDYAGGGTFGASYANQVDEEFVGCPAAK